ncbi:serine hydrolase [Chitinophaga solisilvae]|uniref:serine hydrolase n=1 Tax=Chitinophaga solisilvae TaxID=1233460 RepID=UPI0013699C69|nr:serine hydrolase [Chitinophaga solisilvae]
MKKIILLLLSFSPLLLPAQDSIPSFVRDSLDTYVSRGLTEWQIPGAAVCIIKNGKVIVMKGYGVKEMNTGDKVDEHTVFMIGSNTKAFTGTTLAMLQADKKLSLDDKVQRWLPDFKLYDPWVAREATIRDLLCHRLGFETFQGDFMYFDSDLTKAEVRQKLAQVKPAHSFRSQWGYTNAAFLTAGEIIPKASGKSWEAFLKERIFEPLQMNSTIALTSGINSVANKAAAHTVFQGVLQKIPYGQIDNLAPAGSICSSTEDLSKWVMMLLQNGKAGDKQVVAEEAIAETRLPHSILGNGGHPYNRAHFALYGLGWMLEEYSGREIISHTGGVNGFVTSITLLPEEQLGIIVLTNTDSNGFYEALRDEIRDAWLGLPYRNYSHIFGEYYRHRDMQAANKLQTIRKRTAAQPPTPLPLQAFTGVYRHPVYGQMNITLENGALVMHFSHHKKLLGRLEHAGNNEFLCTYNIPMYGIQLLPYTVAKGKVSSLTVKVDGFVEGTPYQFVKL